ncbi:unnamed protein product [Periconia digitata]|uniref:Uncharacterized protein n=1 Tax=Periconia digitata TaxID=1303443 RepID=A0A9W4U392_9PLEO|nr:unnamed protein product [Periconia digitata]
MLTCNLMRPSPVDVTSPNMLIPTWFLWPSTIPSCSSFTLYPDFANILAWNHPTVAHSSPTSRALRIHYIYLFFLPCLSCLPPETFFTAIWPTFNLDNKMSSTTKVANNRPWTPPDLDFRYLDDPFGPTSPVGENAAKPTRTHAARLEDSGYVGQEQDNIPQQYAHYPDAHPHAKPVRTPDPQAHLGPQYPHTPDSAQIPFHPEGQASPLCPIPPLPPMPWDKSEDLSPVQDALSSCISTLEGLIKTRQPTDDQMDFLVARFEEMTQCLSAPEPQSRQSDEHLFFEFEQPVSLATTPKEDQEAAATTTNGDVPQEADPAEAYMLEVAKYIEDVSKYTGHLRKRLEETKKLNTVSTDIIKDLRTLLKQQYRQLDEYKKRASVLEEKATQVTLPQDKPKPKPTQSRGFWASVGYALDSVGDMWLEW